MWHSLAHDSPVIKKNFLVDVDGFLIVSPEVVNGGQTQLRGEEVERGMECVATVPGPLLYSSEPGGGPSAFSHHQTCEPGGTAVCSGESSLELKQFEFKLSSWYNNMQRTNLSEWWSQPQDTCPA